MLQSTDREAILRLKLFLFDLDGTLYLGDQVYPYSAELLETIRKTGGRSLFMTNNSSKSVIDYVAKLNRLGLPATPDDFITSVQATVHYLRGHYPDAVLYVCGTRSMQEELAQNGFRITTDLDKVNCIVMGFDTELTFRKLEDVCRLLLTRDLPYLATNPDVVCPTEFGSVPDCGSVSEMIFNATGKRPFFIGKPEPLMPQLAMERFGCTGEQTAVIGDRIYTDIRSGLNAGAYSILVMSGETTPEILAASPDKPDLVLPDAGALIPVLRSRL